MTTKGTGVLLEGKTAVVYGAGGNVGGAVSRALARDGARVFLTGRRREPLDVVARGIREAGGRADVAQVDALDRDQIEAHLATVAAEGMVDISFNAAWIRGDLQGTPLIEMALEDFTTPVTVGVTTHFLTATAAARHMVEQGSGVILTLSTSASRLSAREQRRHATGGFGVACGAIEAFSRGLGGEIGPRGVRVVCIRSEALPETWGPDQGPDQRGRYPEGSIGAFMAEGTALGRMPTLAELGDAVAFLASDRASAISRTIVNVSSGSILD